MNSGLKRKLLVVAGAGASVDFGMPSVGDVHNFLLASASRFFPLATDASRNLYGFMFDAIKNHWGTHVAAYLNKTPNYEDVLYAIYALASAYPAGVFTGPLGAFVAVNEFPDVTYLGHDQPFHENILSHLGQHLVDDLIDDFRRRCRAPAPSVIPKLEKLRNFMARLTNEFDVAVVTTNYDDLIYRCLPGVETGFDPADGRFKQGRLIDRESWPCFLHLHGSVHFDMDLIDGHLHGIVWQGNLNDPFHQNSFGRSSVRTAEGNEFPTSAIIAGYGKTEQIQRAPFRTYYSELDRLVHHAHAILFLGFSLSDAHVRQAFGDCRDGRDRPIVFVDYADDDVMLAGHNWDQSDSGPTRAVRVFRVPPNGMEWLGYRHAETVAPVKAERGFERCREPGRRLSLWYNGMFDACLNADKIVGEL